jgi:hypothetical protein
VGLLSGARCPVEPGGQAWVERNMRWLEDQFGREVMLRRTVEPTAEFFPGAYAGSAEDVRRTVARVCKRMRVDYAGLVVEVEPYDDTERKAWLKMGLQYREGGAAGHYRRENGRPVIAISQHLTERPTALVATVAHELGHVLLLDGGLVNREREDQEELTDLLTVHPARLLGRAHLRLRPGPLRCRSRRGPAPGVVPPPGHQPPRLHEAGPALPGPAGPALRACRYPAQASRNCATAIYR